MSLPIYIGCRDKLACNLFTDVNRGQDFETAAVATELHQHVLVRAYEYAESNISILALDLSLTFVNREVT